jgi:hypothetical protein
LALEFAAGAGVDHDVCADFEAGFAAGIDSVLCPIAFGVIFGFQFCFSYLYFSIKLRVMLKRWFSLRLRNEKGSGISIGGEVWQL